jgi:hypothetical protein
MQVKKSSLLPACNDVRYRLFVCKMKKLIIMGVIQAFFVQVELFLHNN